MKATTHALESLGEVAKYTLATCEYAGLASYSTVKRGGVAVSVCFAKIAKPVTWAVSRPFVFIKDKTSKVFRKKTNYPERLESLEEKIRRIDERLSRIEKHGVAGLEKVVLVEEKKKLSEDRLMLLRAIVEANKLLR